MKAAKLEERFSELDGWNAESDAAMLLNDLGIPGENHYKLMKEIEPREKVKVLLAQSLFGNPDILLLDEPFSALDSMTRLSLSDDVYQIIKNEGKTAILVTHDLAEAISMSYRVVVLSKRPTTVKKIYDIHLTNKSTPIQNRKCKEFNFYYDQIWGDLDVHL